MNKNKILFVLGLLLLVFGFNNVLAYYPYYDYQDYRYPYYYDDYVSGNSFAYLDYYGYENGPRYVDNVFSFASQKTTGFTDDGGYKTTRTYTTTTIDYPYYPYPRYPRYNYYYDPYPRQQYFYYY